MNQFVPVVLDIFGYEWFESAHLSLAFKSATLELEEVQVCAKQLDAGAQQVDVWVGSDAETTVCRGDRYW